MDDLANVVPAVLTLAMLGVPLEKWTIYNEPAHASVYTPPDSPDSGRVRDLYMAMGVDLFTNLTEIRDNPGLASSTRLPSFGSTARHRQTSS